MKAAIRQRAHELGFDVCRFTTARPPATASHFQQWLTAGHHGEMAYLARQTPKRIDPQLILPGARSVICLAAAYAGPTPGEALAEPGEPARSARGVVAGYARQADYHDVLGERLRQLVDFLSEGSGHRAQALWYVDTGPVLERDFAQRAGVGFIGKHTNVVSRELGNWCLLAEILTTLDLAPDAPEKNRCGTCTRCLAACPTRAFTAPFQLDARRCISYLTIELKGPIPVELRPLIGNRIFGCDDCLAACPWNRFARAGRLMGEHQRSDLRVVDLVEWLALDEAAFRQRFRGTPILRSKRRGMLRNVCVALGNGGDLSALPALERAAGDREPLIAEHAAWAIEQIRQR